MGVQTPPSHLDCCVTSAIPHPAIRLLAAGSLLLSACSADIHTTTPTATTKHGPPREELVRLDCTGNRLGATISCASPRAALANGASADIYGGQNLYVKLTSSNVSYDAGTELFSFDVTVQNLLNEAIGTPNGVVQDTAGIKVFFHSGPTVTAGTGTVMVANPDGSDTFTGANQPYFKYGQILTKDQVSSARTWQLSMPPTVTNFSFSVYLSVTIQPLLVINEVLANPGGTISDANGEWFEIYNAGSRRVDLQGFLVRDSAVSGIRPPFAIPTSYVVQPGEYVVLGNTTNTTNNGGVPVDIAYGSALALANSLRAIRMERMFGTDTVFIDGISYASAAVSAQNGISRELKNPALANNVMDGSNWADASVTAVYGPGGRGTPKAQNSTFAP